MDGRSFDALSRAVGVRRSRRQVVKGLAGAVLGALLGRQLVQEAGAACTTICPAPEQYLGAGCRCLCKVTGRPPVNGTCPCPAGKTRCSNGVCVSQPVSITCLPDRFSNSAAGVCGQVHTFTPTFTGPAGTTVSCNPASGSVIPPGANPVTCTASAPNGCVESCGFSIQVTDGISPSITCPADLFTGSNPTICGAAVSYTAPVGTDNCPGATTTCTPPPTSIFPLGTTTVTCTTIDASQNTDSCSFTVTIVDPHEPTLTCPADIHKQSDLNQCSTVVNYSTPSGSDNCPGTTVACSPAPGSFFPVGETTVTCTATDASQNAASCTFKVTVQDLQPPEHTCPDDLTVDNDPDECGAVVTYPTPTASDSCPGVGAVECSPPSGSFFQVGTTSVSCRSEDAVGNAHFCFFDVTVNDTQPPTMNCAAAVEVDAEDGRCEAKVFLPSSASDCGVASLSCIPANNSLFPVGQTTAVCTGTDFAGNTSTCTILVTVNDPTGNCP